MDNSNQPAFPLDPKQYNTLGLGDKLIPFGLTKREYFAAKAMQGVLSAGFNDMTGRHSDQVAKIAIIQADELLKQLKGGSNE